MTGDCPADTTVPPLRRAVAPAAALGALLLAASAGCFGAPPARAGDPGLDTTALAAISAHLQRGLAALRDSPAVAVRAIADARALDPEDDVLAYAQAVAHALARDTGGLAATLGTLAARHSCLVPVQGRSFPRMEGAPAVARALRAVRDSAPTGARASAVAFALQQRDLFPEGIAYDSATGAIFLGSLRHRLVVRIARDEAGDPWAAGFTVPGRDSLYSVLGMKIDGARRRLWIATAAEGYAEDESPDETGSSAVVAFDLSSGRRLRRFQIPRPPDRLTNDLALDSSGAAYVTDTRAGTVYRIALDADSVATLLPPGTLTAPNGIVVTPDGRGLLVADGPAGLRHVDLATRAVQRVPQPRGILPLFLDGLAVHGRSLIAIAHPFNLGWVLRFRMNAAFDSITAASVLACNDPRLRQPTTGVMAGDTLFYIGTSQFPLIPRPGRPARTEELADISVMSLHLGPAAAELQELPPAELPEGPPERTAAATPAGVADPTAELMEADRAFAADSRARGAAAWEAVWAERGRKENGAGQQAVGGRAAAASVAPMLERLGPRFRWAPDTAATLWPDSLGYTLGRWRIDPEDSAAPAPSGRYLTVWTREAGAWHVALDLSLPPAERCQGRGAAGFDFWLGNWAVSQQMRDGDGAARTFPAHTTMTRAGACALVESWQGTVQYGWTGMTAPREIRGASVRAWDPDAHRWRIYWIDTVTGAFGAPFRGAFTGGTGEFLAPPLRAGAPARRIRVSRRAGAVLWELAVHPAGGAWTPLWTMTDTRP